MAKHPHIHGRGILLRLVFLLVLLAGNIGLLSQSFADVLIIRIQTTSEVSGERLKVKVKATNTGTGPAIRIQTHMFALGERRDGPVIKQLSPGESHTVFFEKDLSGAKKGRYPLTVRVDFHDLNYYPFSALSGTIFTRGKDVNALLACLLSDVTLEKEGKLEADIKNLGSQRRVIQATLTLPKEFSLPEQRIVMHIGARSEKKLTFEVTNFSALPGATYPAFCFFEYEKGDTHYTAVAKSVIRVREQETLFRRMRPIWTALVGILIIILIAVIAKERKRVKP